MRATILAAFIAVLLFSGYLRLSAYAATPFSPFAAYATPLYVVATIAAWFALSRTGLDFKRLGFGVRFRPWHVAAALIGVVFLQAWAQYGYPAADAALAAAGLDGAGFADERFGDVRGSIENLVPLLILSWTGAAIGEELTFRIVLMRGLAMTMGDGALAALAALIASAAIFGFIHLYKGPVGVVSSAVSGLAFGALVFAARGGIWPAFLAHGVNNTIGVWRLYSDV